MSDKDSSKKPAAKKPGTPGAKKPSAPDIGAAGGDPKELNRTVFTRDVSVELSGEDGFRIRLNKVQMAELFDQSMDTIDSPGQGCISTPTGPHC